MEGKLQVMLDKQTYKAEPLWKRVRKTVALILVFLVALSLSVTPKSIVQATSDSDSWSMFRSDPSHSGVGSGSPALSPKLYWK